MSFNRRTALLSAGLGTLAAARLASGEEKHTSAELVAAESLLDVRYSDEERRQMLAAFDDQLELVRKARSFKADFDRAPAMVFDPRLPAWRPRRQRKTLRWSRPRSSLPKSDEDIAFASVPELSRWIRTRKITSERLTDIYLERLRRLGKPLECVVTIMEDEARMAAQRADKEARKGRFRSPLHGIPWGAKDLFDTRGVSTTWGANPYKDRVPDRNAAVVDRLDAAGAVLVAKLTLGALAYGDVWYGGLTRNPFNLEEGSSGSSAGSASAVVAGLCGFTLGTETLGSIVSPSMRCGATGLRPTFGRVSRHGAMPLCWSLDKIGPICRTVEGAAMVLSSVHGADARDPSAISAPFAFDRRRGL
ncbi:MAG: amidase [Myxococcota bacterium]